MEHVCSVDGIPACEKRVSSCATPLQLSKSGFAEVSQVRQRQQDLDKTADNTTANCFTLCNFFGIKNDNSDVQSVNIQLKVPSSGSMAPCFSHHEITLGKNWIIVVIRWGLNPIIYN